MGFDELQRCANEIKTSVCLDRPSPKMSKASLQISLHMGVIYAVSMAGSTCGRSEGNLLMDTKTAVLTLRSPAALGSEPHPCTKSPWSFCSAGSTGTPVQSSTEVQLPSATPHYSTCFSNCIIVPWQKKKKPDKQCLPTSVTIIFLTRLNFKETKQKQCSSQQILAPAPTSSVFQVSDNQVMP